MATAPRWELIRNIMNEATFANPGKNINESYEAQLQHFEKHNLLTDEEKAEAKKQVTEYKDHQNLLHLKGPKYRCDVCGKEGYTISFCEHCARETLQSKFSTWTSGNDEIDNAIREAQITLPLAGCIIEWIEYEDLTNVKYLAEGGCSKIYKAT